MLVENNKKYFSWTKHFGELKTFGHDIISQKTEHCYEIVVHPSHVPVVIDISQGIVEQVKSLEKSTQLYFFGLVWLDFLDTSTELQLFERVLTDVLSCSKPRRERMRRDMVWDDHALSERVSFLVGLLESPLVETLNADLLDLIQSHIGICTKILEEFIASDEWSNNNHRVFHLCARIAVGRYQKSDDCLGKYTLLLEQTLKNLFHLNTGLSVEQSISYYSFDLVLLKHTLNYLELVGCAIPGLSYSDIFSKNQLSMSVLSFANGELPASGDTPLGMKLKKKIQLTASERSKLKKSLEELGHFIIGSDTEAFNAHLITHNAESAHGHNSPLHIDLWNRHLGYFLVDSGGPYLYGNSLRYQWFRDLKAHNCLCISGDEVNLATTTASYDTENQISGYANFSTGEQRRVVKIENNKVFITDYIKSSESWELFFHFMPLLSVHNSDGYYSLDFNGKKLKMTVATGFTVEVRDGLRTYGRGNKEDARVLVVLGSPGQHVVNVCFEECA